MDWLPINTSLDAKRSRNVVAPVGGGGKAKGDVPVSRTTSRLVQQRIRLVELRDDFELFDMSGKKKKGRRPCCWLPVRRAGTMVIKETRNQALLPIAGGKIDRSSSGDKVLVRGKPGGERTKAVGRFFCKERGGPGLVLLLGKKNWKGKGSQSAQTYTARTMKGSGASMTRKTTSTEDFLRGGRIDRHLAAPAEKWWEEEGRSRYWFRSPWEKVIRPLEKAELCPELPTRGARELAYDQCGI